MKKIITSVLFICSILLVSTLSAQTTHPFELGFNAGASWQKSDIKMKKLGGGGGFTFGQMYLQNDKSALDWGWRFRYLNAVQYGQGNEKFYGIANNKALNGDIDSTTNYYSHGGFIYQNYKNTLNECSLELVIGLNQMRNKTKFYPYVFGGLGITKSVTKTNQLNDNGQRYNYAKVDSLSLAGSGSVTSNLNNLYDGSYETTAEGSTNPSWKFMPSLGLGLGYQATKAVSIGLEYKVTWALSDQLDGIQWANDNTRSLTNDKYYYASAWLKFSFGRKAKPTTTTTSNNTNTIITDQNTLTNTGDKPTVVIINPSTSPYTSTQKSYTVKATVTNVTSKSDIGLVANGVSNSDFIYDASSHMFSFPTMLVNGSNSFMITATNAAGSNNAIATVIYNEPIVVPPPTPAPIVTITNPMTNPFSTTLNTANVNATVLNVASQSQISVLVNGVSITGFVFNPSTHGLNFTSNLMEGVNSVVVNASNSAGNDSKSISIIYNKPVQSPPPVITITFPAVNPYTSVTDITAITSIVKNVTALGQISVTVNGSSLPTSRLTFNTATGALNFNANLIAGANSIVISATNIYGADSKAETIIYSPQVVVVQKPVVTITSPVTNPFNTSINSITVAATVLNVTSSSQISVNINGTTTSAFTFNVGTKQLSLLTALIEGANLITITATNSAGADSKSQTVIYSQPITALPAPVISITLPTSNPYTTTANTATVNATILNVSSMSQISVSFNGSGSPAFTFNAATKQFSFITTLIVGANLVTITATNSSGVDTKSQTIISSQPAAVVVPPVVTITSPVSNPFNTTSHTSVVNASILNVTTASQISVSINGTPISAFAFNPSTHLAGIPVSLISGTNLFTITATNSAGTDTKSETIIYTPPVVVLPPVITITSPTTNPFSTSVNTSVVNATVLNVTTASQIGITVNGISTTVFSFSSATHVLGFTVNLVSGTNSVVINATNSVGVDTKTETIIYTPAVVVPPPVVTITLPASVSSTTSSSIYNVEGFVYNVGGSSDVSVYVNGVSIPAFTFTVSTKKVKFTANLNEGTNTISISGHNSAGSDSKTVTVIYTRVVSSPLPDTIATPVGPHGGGPTTTSPINHRGGGVPAPGGAPAGGSLPTIVFSSTNPYSTSDAYFSSEAIVSGVLNPESIVVKVNSVVVPITYNIHSETLSFSGNLNVGANTVLVEATNSAGTKSATLIINRH